MKSFMYRNGDAPSHTNCCDCLHIIIILFTEVTGCVCVAIRTGAIQFSKPKMESKRKVSLCYFVIYKDTLMHG